MIDDPAVEVVVITAPNMLHLELIEAAAQAGKHVFCEKPVGGTPAQTARAERCRARRRDHRRRVQLPLGAARALRQAAAVAAGALGTLTNYRGRFFSMYGADPLGLLSWRFRVDEGGYGVTSDLLSHAVDLAHFLIGPITRLVGTIETFIRERPIAVPGGRPLRPRARRGPARRGDQRGLRGGAVRVRRRRARDVRGQPRDRRPGEPDGVRRLRHRRRDGLEPRGPQPAAPLPAHGRSAPGYTTVYGGDRFPYHGASCRAPRTGSASRTWS